MLHTQHCFRKGVPIKRYRIAIVAGVLLGALIGALLLATRNRPSAPSPARQVGDVQPANPAAAPLPPSVEKASPAESVSTTLQPPSAEPAAPTAEATPDLAVSEERKKAYLQELKNSRTTTWGDCIATNSFLRETGQAGMPAVLEAFIQNSGPENVSMRRLILNGAVWFNDHTKEKLPPDLLLPLMLQAGKDPDSAIRTRAEKWLKAREENKAAK